MTTPIFDDLDDVAAQPTKPEVQLEFDFGRPRDAANDEAGEDLK